MQADKVRDSGCWVSTPYCSCCWPHLTAWCVQVTHNQGGGGHQQQ